MTHEVDVVAAGPDVVGYSVRCAHTDGSRVLCVATAQLRDGRIVCEVAGEALGRLARTNPEFSQHRLALRDR